MNGMRRYLTEAEQQRLLKTVRAQRDPLAQRDYHWIRALILTGARINEWSLMTLAQAEMALRSGWLVVKPQQRKGGKRGQEYCVTQPLRECLEALTFMARTEAAAGAAAGEPPLVWGRDGAALSVRSYQARLKLWVTEAGLDPRTSCHWLRHTRGMNVIRRSRGNNPLKVAQEALGHASLASTGIYTQMTREEIAAEMHQIDGGRVPKRQARREALGAQA